MKNDMKDITAGYGSVQAMFWLGYSVVSPYAAAYLLGKGLSNSSLGLILFISNLAATIAQPYLGGLIDGSRKLTNRHVMAASALLMTITCTVMFIMDKRANIVCIVMLALNYFMVMLLQPVLNALAMEYTNSGFMLKFGIARALGSLGFAINSYIIGSLVERIGLVVAPAEGIIGFGILFLAAAFALPGITEKSEAGSAQKEAAGGISPAEFIRKYPLFSLFLLGMVCVYFTHSILNVYTLQIIQEKGGGPGDVGIVVGIAATAELIPMMFFPKLQRRFGLPFLIKLSAVFFNVKILLSLVVANMPGFYAIQIFQAGGWGLMCITVVYYVNEIIHLENSSQGQAFAGMSCTVGSVLATLICGRLIDMVGVKSMVLTGCGIGIAGLVIVMIAVNAIRKKA